MDATVLEMLLKMSRQQGQQTAMLARLETDIPNLFRELSALKSRVRAIEKASSDASIASSARRSVWIRIGRIVMWPIRIFTGGTRGDG